MNNLFSLHESDDEHVELNQIQHSKHKELSIHALSRVIKHSNSSFHSLKNSPGGVGVTSPTQNNYGYRDHLNNKKDDFKYDNFKYYKFYLNNNINKETILEDDQDKD